VHNACSSGAFALETAAQRIRSGQADVMFVVGGEAFDTAVRLEWFRRLQLYCLDGIMRPFESPSSGFYVGEGAAALVLESAAHAERRGATPYAVYLGGAFAHQGWKQTLPDLPSALLADVIVRTLESAKVTWEDLDLVVPHGAATGLSDAYEADCTAKAIARIGGTHSVQPGPVAAAFKPQFGHLLATSGLVEIAAALLCLRRQCVPPSTGGSPNRQFPIPFVARPTPRKIKNVLKIGTGFTGHDSACLFRCP
jgi:3-oxoacyl-[acyl-carrier-protein] synthase II